MMNDLYQDILQSGICKKINFLDIDVMGIRSFGTNGKGMWTVNNKSLGFDEIADKEPRVLHNILEDLYEIQKYIDNYKKRFFRTKSARTRNPVRGGPQ